MTTKAAAFSLTLCPVLSALHRWDYQQASGLLRGGKSRGRCAGASVRQQNGADCRPRQ